MTEKKKPTFLRRVWTRHSKLGMRRKNKQKWVRPTGRHNKIRGKLRGYPVSVSIGYTSSKDERGKINGKIPLLVTNLKELEKAKKENIIIVGKIGTKKKLEIMNMAQEKKIEVYRIDPKKFVEKNSRKKTVEEKK